MSFASPILYKKTSTGKIQQWKIWTKGSTIFSESGQTDGKKIQSSDTIKSGKNIGKKTETTTEQQAIAEAKAKFEKQLKKGYVRTVDDAKADKVDKAIKGGLKLMKAHGWEKQKKKIKYPCAVQPKFDGIRGGYDFQSQTMWSYTRKPILSAQHILDDLIEQGCGLIFNWDGELYNHEFKDNFEEISSAVRREKTENNKAALMQYHIYDIVDSEKTFAERLEIMEAVAENISDDSPIKFAKTIICHNEEEVVAAYDELLDLGYEGAIVRNLDGKYEGKRSMNVLKMKLFEDAEFKVIGMEEGRGKLQGHAAKFICEINDKHGKRTFKAKAKGKQKFLQDCFTNPKLWKNRTLTVTFMGYTRKNILPRHGVGKAFRDDGW